MAFHLLKFEFHCFKLEFSWIKVRSRRTKQSCIWFIVFHYNIYNISRWLMYIVVEFQARGSTIWTAVPWTPEFDFQAVTEKYTLSLTLPLVSFALLVSMLSLKPMSYDLKGDDFLVYFCSTRLETFMCIICDTNTKSVEELSICLQCWL